MLRVKRLGRIAKNERLSSMVLRLVEAFKCTLRTCNFAVEIPRIVYLDDKSRVLYIYRKERSRYQCVI